MIISAILIISVLAVWIAHMQSRIEALEDDIRCIQNDVEHLQVFGEHHA
jgi:hypothetical protein